MLVLKFYNYLFSVYIKVGKERVDPKDKCSSVSCERQNDTSIVRREKEKTCNHKCQIGQTYIEAEPERFVSNLIFS